MDGTAPDFVWVDASAGRWRVRREGDVAPLDKLYRWSHDAERWVLFRVLTQEERAACAGKPRLPPDEARLYHELSRLHGGPGV